MATKPDLDDLLRAQGRRTPNNPFSTPVEPPRITYRDPTADQAVANVMREQRGNR
jgi:hypothetical protein